jgi:MFS family permease
VIELRRRFGGLDARFWALQAGLLLNRCGQFVQPLLTFWLTGVHRMSLTDAGAVVGGYGLGSSVGTAMGGVLADRVGRRRTLLASALGSALMLGLLSGAGHPRSIATGVFVLAMFYDLHRPAVHAMVADVVQPADRTRAFSITYTTVNLGFAVAPALAGWLADRSYTLVFLVAASIQVAWAVYVLTQLSESRPVPRTGELVGGFVDVLKDRLYVVFLLVMVLASLVPHQGFVALSAWMKQEGFSAATFGTVIGLNGLLIVLVQPWVGDFLGRQEPSRMFVASALLQGLGFSMHGLGLGIPGHVAAVTVWTVGEIAQAPLIGAVVATLSPVHLRGRYQGLLAMSFASASFLGPWLGAWAMDEVGRAMWGGCLLAGVVSAACWAALAPYLRARLAVSAAA